ncbi:MucR family transcriptional regulator [Methylobacterium iners]|uniref:MucR family transcriptional regulator n=1 Tax=Methylobacterium iners TaxID=418707 RepID=A0ABQ4S3R0_9HYPH|nr:MucR family transcriptional regulator [Methylobacterium iners]GJD97093.1 hypothetical protein OCOJLMKI_4321 [Methylobacterium iners]
MSDDVAAQFVDQTNQINPVVELTAEIVCAFVANNSVPTAGLADLLQSVHQALLGLGQSTAAVQEEVTKATPAQIRKSVTDEGLISFEDSKTYKTLKRHLAGRGLTPESYRAKHGLPADYPMTSAAYSAQRSALAHSLGLGQQRRRMEPKTVEVAETVEEAPRSPRGRATSASPSKAAVKGRGKKAEAAADEGGQRS